MATENHPHQDEHPTLHVELTVYRVRGEVKNFWRVVATRRADLSSGTRITREYPNEQAGTMLEHALREVMLR
jgi:hypothetical protein